MTTGSTSRPINEVTGVKRPSSVLVRGLSHMEIAKLIGAIPQWYTEEQYVEWARGARGYSTYELWTQIPGNENKTLEEFFEYLGFVEAAQTTEVINAVNAAQAASAASATAAAGSATAAAGSATSAAAARDAAEAAQAAAEAAAASVDVGVTVGVARYFARR